MTYVATTLQHTAYNTITVDETTDISNRQQVVLCFCWVDDNFDIHEDFVGMYTIEAVDADTLVSIIHDVLQSLNLTMS